MKPGYMAVLLCALSAAGHAGEGRRQAIELRSVAEPAGRTGRTGLLAPREASAKMAGARRAADPLPQAPGVIQLNLFDRSHIVWFVNTQRLPANTLLEAFLLLPDDRELALEPWRLTEALPAGSTLELPQIRVFGDFWPEGLVTFAMILTVNGRETQTAADFPVNAKRGFEAVTNMVPRVDSALQSLADRNVYMTLRGVFRGEAPQLVIEDVVVPESAIRYSDREIVVNLSAVSGLDLGGLQESLVTVGQGGWSDTYIFRYIPPSAGGYNTAGDLQ